MKANSIPATAAAALVLLIAASGCIGQKSADELYGQLVEIDARNLPSDEYQLALTNFETEAQKISSQNDFSAINNLIELRMSIEKMKASTIAARNELDKIGTSKIDCTSTGPILNAASHYSDAIESAGIALENWNNAEAINSGLAESDRHFIDGIEDTISQLGFLKGELEKACNIAYLGK